MSAPPPALQAFARERREALDAAVDRFSALGRETFVAGAGRAFAVAYAQLPAFSEWAYSWIASYLFSYQVMYSVAKAGAATLTGGDAIKPAVREATIATVAQEFDARVLVPAGLAADVETAQADARTVVRDEMERFLERERQAWESFAAQSCPLPPNASAARRLLITGALIPGDSEAARAQAPIDGEIARIFGIRALRPFAVRMAIPTLATFGIGGASGFGAGLVLGAGMAWTMDYVVNSTDAMLNRSKLDVLLVSRMQAEEARVTAEVAAALRTGIDSGTADYRATLNALAFLSASNREAGRESPIVAPPRPGLPR